METDCFSSIYESSSSPSPYALLLHAFSLIPFSRYVLAFLILCIAFFYNFLEFHLFRDFFSGFRGSSIRLTYHPSSPIYDGVVSKCKILHGRYLATPWLSSPHFQTGFLHFFGRPPVFSYRRQLFQASDGGTIALDWLMKSHVLGDSFHMGNTNFEDEETPIMVVIPGLTSDSDSAYIKHLAFNTVKLGWNVVVSNHRGLGGVSITSDCFYNAGWTEDIRVVIDYLHHEYPKAPLFAVGTSIGANILVKYLGEEGERTPVAGAAAICNPWDLVIGDRFICRRLLQKLYDRALTIGLQGYAQLHEPRYSRLANWEGITKSRSIRDFDNYATCLVGKFETVDTYYRRCSSASYVTNVSVPLLCVSALDDPVCTKEAIPWDECRTNKNVVLATPQHGGHVAFFEGLTAAGLWWVRAVDEFVRVLHSSPYMHVQKTETSGQHLPAESSIDQGPYVNFAEDGMVAAMGNDQTKEATEDSKLTHADAEQEEHLGKAKSHFVSEQDTKTKDVESRNVVAPVRRLLKQISRQNRISIWLLGFMAVITTWPFLGSVIYIVFGKKLSNALPAAFLRK